MMIIVQLEFDKMDVDRILAAFLSLPPSLCPTHFGDDESLKKARSVENSREFAAFIEKNRRLGFFLFAPDILYNVSIGPMTLTADFRANDSLAQQFIIHMAKTHPIFGFACTEQERNHRNRITVKHGLATTESWVGRDTQKYLPGLYWLTLLSNGVLEKHGIPLSSLKRVAEEYTELEGGLHLFRFYGRPEDWNSPSGLTDLYASLPGLFDVSKIKSLAAETKNWGELNAFLKNWR